MSIILLAGAVALVVAGAEWIHARRIRRIAHLAFGRSGRPSAWVSIVPLLRVAAAAAIVVGAMLLRRHQPVPTDEVRSARASKQLLICLDVSPSMYSEDAGDRTPNVTRARWASYLMKGILDRVDTSDTRISLIAFYTKAVPLLTDTYDKELVANALAGLPLFSAFEPGDTDLIAGVDYALKTAKPWARKSTTLIVISDGDVNTPVSPDNVPASIADVIVIGVGDTRKSSQVGVHTTRQDAQSLKLLAARLGGKYVDANRHTLSPAILNSLRMVTPAIHTPWSDRELGIAFLCFGTLTLTLIQPALMWFGTRRVGRRDTDDRWVRSGGFSTETPAPPASVQGVPS